MAEELNIVTPEGAETTAPSFHEKIGNMNIVTPEGADTSAPSFHEKIGNMKYNVVLHFAENGGQTVKDRLKRVILHEANTKSGTTNP